MSKKLTTQIFFWKGINSRGFRAEGEISARSITEVREILATQKVTVLKVSKRWRMNFFSIEKKVNSVEITELSVELTTLLSAGISLAMALNIMSESARSRAVKNLLNDMKKQVENGQLLSDAMKKRSHCFDDFFCNLVYVGENSGTLDLILKHIVLHREKMALLKRKVKKALFYPSIVLIVSLVITCAMLMFVMPQFERLFQNVGSDLPTLTKIVIRSADFLKQNGILLFLSPIIGYLLLKMGVQRFESWQYFFDRFCPKCPLIGKILLGGIFVRCFHTFYITLKAGLPLLDALQLTKNVAGNRFYARSFDRISQQIKNGQTLSAALKNTRLFPPRVIHMINIGEESGHLENMLQKLTDYFSEQVDYKIQRLTQLLEPSLMVFLSGLVGTLVIAMYLPIFRLGSVF